MALEEIPCCDDLNNADIKCKECEMGNTLGKKDISRFSSQHKIPLKT